MIDGKLIFQCVYFNNWVNDSPTLWWICNCFGNENYSVLWFNYCCCCGI